MTSSVVLLTVGGCGTVLFAVFAWLSMRDRLLRAVQSRARELSRRGSDGSHAAIRDDAWQRPSAKTASSRMLDHLSPGSGEDRSHHELRLKQAGMTHPSSLARFFTARLLGLTVPFAIVLGCGYVGIIPMNQSTLYAVIAGVVGWLLPTFWLDRRIATRQSDIRRALPDFMDLMIVCLESGLSVPATLQRVTEEINLAHPQLAAELEIVQRDTMLGASIDAALLRFAERSGLDVVRILATFIRESRRIGSEIVEAMRSHAEAMRYQREQAAEENAQKASVKILFPMLLLILPAVFVVLAGPAVIQIQSAFSK